MEYLEAVVSCYPLCGPGTKRRYKILYWWVSQLFARLMTVGIQKFSSIPGSGGSAFCLQTRLPLSCSSGCPLQGLLPGISSVPITFSLLSILQPVPVLPLNLNQAASSSSFTCWCPQSLREPPSTQFWCPES